MSHFFDDLGIHASDIVAGFIGGVVRVLMPPFMGAWSSAATIVIGALTAAYMTEPAISMIGDKIPRGAVGFIIGLGAMVLCQGLIGAVNVASSHIKFPGGGPKDA